MESNSDVAHRCAVASFCPGWRCRLLLLLPFLCLATCVNQDVLSKLELNSAIDSWVEASSAELYLAYGTPTIVTTGPGEEGRSVVEFSSGEFGDTSACVVRFRLGADGRVLDGTFDGDLATCRYFVRTRQPDPLSR